MDGKGGLQVGALAGAALGCEDRVEGCRDDYNTALQAPLAHTHWAMGRFLQDMTPGLAHA